MQVTFPTSRGLVRAVDGVELDVHRGEVLALVGESGCGKTTLIRSILGLERMSAGTVVFDGSPVSRRASSLRALRRRVQMIFQDPTGALNPRHTIYEAVAEGIRIHKVAGDEPTLVADALARAGLRPPARYLRRYPHEVSGGQRQRVLIAGAMALGPQLLLADEPVASLDASIRGEILALMRSLVDEHGISIIAVTHDLGLAWNIADRVAVMYLGRIVELGATEQVLVGPAAPVHPGAAVGRSREGTDGAADPHRRDARPQPDPVRLSFPPALPARRQRSGRATRDRAGVPRRRRRPRRARPGPLRRLPRLRLTPIAPPPVLSASDEPPLRLKQTGRRVRRSERAGERLAPLPGGERLAVAGGDELDDDVDRLGVRPHVDGADRRARRLRPADRERGAALRPRPTRIDGRHAELALVHVVDRRRRAVPRSGRRIASRTRVSRPSTSCEMFHTTPSASSLGGPSPGANTCVDSARPSTTGMRSAIDARSTLRVSGPGGGQQFGQSLPAMARRSVWPGVKRPRRRLELERRRRSTRRASAATVRGRRRRRGRPASSRRGSGSSIPRVISADVPSGNTSHSRTARCATGAEDRTRSDTGCVAEQLGPLGDRPVVRQRPGVVGALVERLAPRQPAGARDPRRHADVAARPRDRR